MANRSYLYSLEFDRTKGDRKEGEKIIGLSECPYAIPLSYKILVSQDAKESKSINWDYEHPIAIIADFKKGKEKLYDFLSTLSTQDLFDRDELQNQIDTTKQFLDSVNLKFVILECGEIYELAEEELEIQNKELYEKEVLKIDEQIHQYLKNFKEMKGSISRLKSEIEKLSKPKGIFSKMFSSDKSKEIEALEKELKEEELEMWNMLGINYWSNVLYYHFENE